MAVTGTPAALELEDQLALIYAALGGVGAPATIILPWAPVPKARPRHMKNGRTYQDPKDRAAEAQTRAMLLHHSQDRLEANVAVVAAFCRPDRRQMDTDNLLKHLLDAANNVLFYDDAQVTASAAVLEYDPSRPRTVLLIGEHSSSMPRTIAAASPRRRKSRGM